MKQKLNLGDKIGPGGLPIWKGWDARRKFWIKPLKETHLGVVQAFFDPLKRPC